MIVPFRQVPIWKWPIALYYELRLQWVGLRMRRLFGRQPLFRRMFGDPVEDMKRRVRAGL